MHTYVYIYIYSFFIYVYIYIYMYMYIYIHGSFSFVGLKANQKEGRYFFPQHVGPPSRRCRATMPTRVSVEEKSAQAAIGMRMAKAL